MDSSIDLLLGEGSRTVDRMCGIDPDRPVHEYCSALALKRAQRSLSESTGSNVIPMHLQDGDLRVPVVIDMRIRPLFDPRLVGVGVALPDWYFQGWLAVPPWRPQTYRVRILLYPASVQAACTEHRVRWQEIITRSG